MRYIKLKSIGAAIDSYTLTFFPLSNKGKIMFEEPTDIRNIENTEVFDNMDEEDRKSFKSIVEAHEKITLEGKRIISLYF